MLSSVHSLPLIKTMRTVLIWGYWVCWWISEFYSMISGHSQPSIVIVDSLIYIAINYFDVHWFIYHFPDQIGLIWVLLSKRNIQSSTWTWRLRSTLYFKFQKHIAPIWCILLIQSHTIYIIAVKIDHICPIILIKPESNRMDHSFVSRC